MSISPLDYSLSTFLCLVFLVPINVSGSSYLLASQSTHEEVKFPLRSTYSNTITISHSALKNNLEKYLIIDVRSAYEFNVLHINTAINIPITNLGFIPKIQTLRLKDKRSIIFYCNGITCRKSYLANIQAQKSKIKNVITFDLGILPWAKLYPEQTSYFGKKSLPLDKLISKEKFDSHNLSPEDFIKKVNQNSLLIDIREPFQRQGSPLNKLSIHAPINDFHNLLTTIKKQKSTLLIFDEVGKQIIWLQYLLEQQGITNYYFMSGGIEAYLAANLDKTYPDY